MGKIASVQALQILDSRGNPTVEVELTLDSGAVGRAAVPSGASTGEFEAVELRDGGDAWAGKGVATAVANVNGEIAKAITGRDAADQAGLDAALIELDGTPNKSRLGANALLGVSLAAAKAAAAEAGQPLYRQLGGEQAATLPVPMMNVLNGGVHADNRVDFQEFMIVPAGVRSLRRRAARRLRGLPRPEEMAEGSGALDRRWRRGRLRPRPLLQRGRARRAGARHQRRRLRARRRCRDRARPGRQRAVPRRRLRARAEGRTLDASELAAYWQTLCERYPVVSIEDGMDEEDWDGWKLLTERIGERIQLVGDDLFVTNPERLRRGIELGVANAILIKVNQIGTLTETLEAVRIAREAGYASVISHRSGETEDTTIADLAVATGCGQIKTGAPSRSDRVAKYNQLLRIEQRAGRRRDLSGLEARSRARRSASSRSDGS